MGREAVLLLRRQTVLFGLVAWAVLPTTAEEPAVGPSPELTPRQVVEAQLEAFRHNDDPAPDAGIKTAFAFASEGNRKITGPIDRFIRMVKNPTYAPLLNHRAASLSNTTQVGDQARIEVTLLTASGEEAAYVWLLGLRREPPCSRCWFTDTVMRVQVGDSPFLRASLK